MFSMAALAWSDVAVFQSSSFEKLSVRTMLPRPGRISGVGSWVENGWAEGVADGGNQTMVAVGIGVSVGICGVGVVSIASTTAQELVSIRVVRAVNRNFLAGI